MAKVMCTYCAKWFQEDDTSPLPHDDSPQLARRYCLKCFPEVESAHQKLPWVKKKVFGD